MQHELQTYGHFCTASQDPPRDSMLPRHPDGEGPGLGSVKQVQVRVGGSPARRARADSGSRRGVLGSGALDSLAVCGWTQGRPEAWGQRGPAPPSVVWPQLVGRADGRVDTHVLALSNRWRGTWLLPTHEGQRVTDHRSWAVHRQLFNARSTSPHWTRASTRPPRGEKTQVSTCPSGLPLRTQDRARAKE